jgi:hypothetical protein
MLGDWDFEGTQVTPGHTTFKVKQTIRRAKLHPNLHFHGSAHICLVVGTWWRVTLPGGPASRTFEHNSHREVRTLGTDGNACRAHATPS